jgi:hypothetical protein
MSTVRRLGAYSDSPSSVSPIGPRQMDELDGNFFKTLTAFYTNKKYFDLDWNDDIGYDIRDRLAKFIEKFKLYNFSELLNSYPSEGSPFSDREGGVNKLLRQIEQRFKSLKENWGIFNRSGKEEAYTELKGVILNYAMQKGFGVKNNVITVRADSKSTDRNSTGQPSTGQPSSRQTSSSKTPSSVQPSSVQPYSGEPYSGEYQPPQRTYSVQPSSREYQPSSSEYQPSSREYQTPRRQPPPQIYTGQPSSSEYQPSSREYQTPRRQPSSSESYTRESPSLQNSSAPRRKITITPGERLIKNTRQRGGKSRKSKKRKNKKSKSRKSRSAKLR